MPDIALNAPAYPFAAFNFAVEIVLPGASAPLCAGAFSECDGLEMSMEVKTIREGGNNGRQVRLSGPLAFGQLTLKRGMSRGFELWAWFTRCRDDPRVRADAEVVMLAADRTTECARFVLSRCVPVKLKAAALSAKDGQVAVEELQLAYESIRLEPAPKAA